MVIHHLAAGKSVTGGMPYGASAGGERPVNQFPWNNGCKEWTVGLHGNSAGGYCSCTGLENTYALDFGGFGSQFEIVAPAPGTIEWAGNAGGDCGNRIYLRHDNGYKTEYCHLSRIVTWSGHVNQSQPIAYAGNTGNSYGNHLHWALYNSSNQRISWDDKIIGNWRIHVIRQNGSGGCFMYGQAAATREGQSWWSSLATTTYTGNGGGCPPNGSGWPIYAWIGSPPNTKNSFIDFYTVTWQGVRTHYNGAAAHQFCGANGG